MPPSARALLAFGRQRLEKVADCLVVALAAALPWSTSAVGLLAVLWIVTVVLTLDAQALRRAVLAPPGGLPVLLCGLAILGMLWAFDATLAERWDGLKSFFKLLVIPVLMVQFARSPRGFCVMIGFIISCGLLMALSWGILLVPSVRSVWPIFATPGVPVRDYIAQSGEFTFCIFALAWLVVADWRERRILRASLLGPLAMAFFLNIVFVSTSRTMLVALPVLLLLFACTQLTRRAAIVLLASAAVAGALSWSFSSLVHTNIVNLIAEVREFNPQQADTRAGARLEFWREGIGVVSAAPVIGHGTGSIRAKYREATAGRPEAGTTNPHNQTMAVAIQLGIVGTAVLFAMWLAHLMMFRGEGLAAWAGLVIVAQNIIGSLFNSHLFDFMQGWGYAIGVGVAAGMVLRTAAAPSPAAPSP